MADVKGIVIPDGDVFTRIDREHKQFAAITVVFAHLVVRGKQINEEYKTEYFDIHTLDDLAVCLYRNQDMSFDDMVALVSQLETRELDKFYQ